MVLTKKHNSMIRSTSNCFIISVFVFILISSISLSTCQETNVNKELSSKNNSTNSYVIYLNEKEFKDFNATNDFYFIEFYETWCGHCKELKPLYEATAKKAFESGSAVKYVAVEASKNQKLSAQFNVQGYPTIWFINNKKNKKIEFKEDRTESSFFKFAETNMLEFIIEYIDSQSTSLEAFDNFILDLEKKLKRNLLITFSDPKKNTNKFSSFDTISGFMIENFGNIYNFELNENTKQIINELINRINSHFNIKLEIIKNFQDEDFYTFSKLYNLNTDSFEQFELLQINSNEWVLPDLLKASLKFYRHPIFSNTTNDIITYTLETGAKSIFVFYNEFQNQDLVGIKKIKKERNNKTDANATETVSEKTNDIEDSEEKSEYLQAQKEGKLITQEFIKETQAYILSNNLRKEIVFSYTTLKNPTVNILVDILKFTEKQLPLFLLTKSREGYEEDLDKYKVEKIGLSKDNLAKFVEDFKANKMPKFLTSEDLPKNATDQNGIYNIVGLNFEDFLKNYDKDIYLFVCSKYSKNCKKFKPVLNNVGKMFQGNEHSVLIGLTDPDYNEYNVDIQQIYPSLIFLPKSAHELSSVQRFENSVFFEDVFTTQKIKNFILENTREGLNLSHIGNETEIDLHETKPDNLVKALRIDESNEKADEAYDIADMLGNLGSEDKLADLFKGLAGQREDGKDVDIDSLGGLEDFKKLLAGFGNMKNIGMDNMDMDNMDMDNMDMDNLDLDKLKEFADLSKLGKGFAGLDDKDDDDTDEEGEEEDSQDSDIDNEAEEMTPNKDKTSESINNEEHNEPSQFEGIEESNNENSENPNIQNTQSNTHANNDDAGVINDNVAVNNEASRKIEDL